MSRELVILEYFEGSPKVVPKCLLVAGPPGTLRLLFIQVLEPQLLPPACV